MLIDTKKPQNLDNEEWNVFEEVITDIEEVFGASDPKTDAKENVPHDSSQPNNMKGVRVRTRNECIAKTTGGTAGFGGLFGALAGAAAGSAVPVVGTITGAIVGFFVGAGAGGGVGNVAAKAAC